MKTLYRRLTSSILLAFITLSVIAQSISGNVSSFESETTFGYATVDIYKGEVLVASVLTDDAGALFRAASFLNSASFFFLRLTAII